MLSAALQHPFCDIRTDMPPPKNPHRRASDAEDIINERLRSGVPPPDPVLETDMKAATGLGRLFDTRIPLVYILGLVGTYVGFQFMLWSSVQNMNTSMAEVKAKLETSTTQTVETRSDVNRLKDRVDRAADDYRALQQQFVQLQQQQYQQYQPPGRR